MEKLLAWGLVFMAAYTLYAVTLGQHLYIG